jgi:hypothetical protein
MHTVKPTSSAGSKVLIHSTELSEDGLDLSRRQINSQSDGVCGPAVLLPRVGQPNKRKIVLYRGKSKVILSDCVIALKCRTYEEASKVRSTILDNWVAIERAYGGTCARYITLNSLTEFLEDNDFDVRLDKGITAS